MININRQFGATLKLASSLAIANMVAVSVVAASPTQNSAEAELRSIVEISTNAAAENTKENTKSTSTAQSTKQGHSLTATNTTSAPNATTSPSATSTTDSSNLEKSASVSDTTGDAAGGGLTSGKIEGVVPNSEANVAAIERAKRQFEANQENLAADHYDLARHYFHKNELALSELELEAAIMFSPTLRAAHRDFCVVSLLRGQPLRSIAEFLMVVGLGEPIPLNDSEKAALCKRAAKMHYEKGLNYGIEKAWKKATPEFLWALSYAPDSAAISHSLAFSYAAAGDFENAERQYKKALALDPANAYSHADFAILLSDHGDQKQAMAELAKAIRLSSKVAALHVDMAWLAEASGDLKTAETEFHEALQLSPKHAGLWSHLGRVEEKLGKAKDAKTAYSEALAVDPGDDEAKARLTVLDKSGDSGTTGGSGLQVNPEGSKKQS